MEEGVNIEDDYKKEITAENEYEGEMHRDITEYEKWINWYALDKVIGQFLDDIYPVEIEECINDKVYEDNEKNDEEKEENETADSESTKMAEGKRDNDERGGEDVDLVEEEKFSSRSSPEFLNEKYDSVGEFDLSTCSGDRSYDFFDKEE